MGFSRQEYWSGLPFPSPGDLPDPGIEPGSPASKADALTSEPPGSSKAQLSQPLLYKQGPEVSVFKVSSKAPELDHPICKAIAATAKPYISPVSSQGNKKT